MADLRAAFAFLTILPLGYDPQRPPGAACAWYPVVGLCIGALLALIAHAAPFAPPLTALVVLVAWVVITGGLHLDGFADSCDGLLATVTPARRLEIMKDPRAGTWAVVGLVLLLLGKWLLIQPLPPLLLLLPPVIGRCAMVLALYALPPARPAGLGRYFRQGLGRPQVLAAVLVTAGLVALLKGGALLLLLPGVVLLTRWAARRLGGGLTGDVYGAVCELTEVLCLMGWLLWAG
ncbi:MAG: adenosylcobinamide-GDP ribazoletransferase [Anaerolineae bacterium]|jgi:adenosylcobinamide-GDP ribazoletransferase|nr:adenosylcobinamide-GDP ribazoletransferase [Anaerolineae bacterium]